LLFFIVVYEMMNTANAAITGMTMTLYFTGISFQQDNRMFKNKTGKNPY
jgi:hypothetical protein